MPKPATTIIFLVFESVMAMHTSCTPSQQRKFGMYRSLPENISTAYQSNIIKISYLSTTAIFTEDDFLSLPEYLTALRLQRHLSITKSA
jgi:hypothetical protein